MNELQDDVRSLLTTERQIILAEFEQQLKGAQVSAEAMAEGQRNLDDRLKILLAQVEEARLAREAYARFWREQADAYLRLTTRIGANGARG